MRVPVAVHRLVDDWAKGPVQSAAFLHVAAERGVHRLHAGKLGARELRAVRLANERSGG